MMKNCLIVDGYNIINAWQELQHLKEESLEHAREKLIEYLIEYQSFQREKVILVFDAHMVKGGLEIKENIGGIEVIYSKEDEIADLVIESLVHKLIGQYRSVTVATSDGLEQHIILGQGAYRLSARELWYKIASNKEKIEQKRIELERKNSRNLLSSHLSQDIVERLEKIRRGEKNN